MRILYDLRYASPHFTGIGTHAWQLLRALLETREPAETWVLAWNPRERATRFDPELLRLAPGVEWLETDAPPLGLRAPLATGALVRDACVDAYLSPFYLRPLGAGVPSVLTLHDAMHLAPEVGAPARVRELFRLALAFTARAEAVVTSSEFSRTEIMRRTFLPAERLSVAPLGTPEREAGEASRPAGVPEAPFALVVGGNRPHKNLRLLARVWRESGAGAPLVLVSAGAVDGRFPGLEELGAGPRAVSLGGVAEAELRWLYAHATLLLFPTRYEGFGLPLLEAAAAGVPVLCSDLPVLRESGEDFARFLPLEDAAAWREAVVGLAADADARAHMSAAGRAAAAARTYAACADRVRAVVTRVVRAA
ncbi:MAG: glycosyltransferase family 1 protein [Candidatus Eisenbacteria bacterium]